MGDADHGYSYGTELAAAIEAARRAGAAVRDFYDRDAARTYTKDDGSPVTDADLAADRIVRETLVARFPADAILTEEGADDPARLGSDRVWIVDPIDGTAQFVARTGEFDILIALVVGGRPAVAAIHHPPSGVTLSAVAGAGAWAEGDGAARRPLRFSPPPATVPRLATSIWYGAPASAPTLARVAARLGAAPPPVLDTGFNPRFLLGDRLGLERRFDALVGFAPDGYLSGGEWDLAALDLLAEEAGGLLTTLRGERFAYNQPVAVHTGGILLATTRELHARLVEVIAPELPQPPSSIEG